MTGVRRGGGSAPSRFRKTPPPSAAADDRHNYRLLVEYDGTRYGGFQVQPNARTVAGELESAVAGALGRHVPLIGAGRTDAGVHAEGQVVNFLWPAAVDVRDLREQVNDRLPADVNVLRVEEVEASFHARARALSRTYRYQVSTRRDAFRKRLVWWIRSELDRARLLREAESAMGGHDFAAFSDADQEDTWLRVTASGWSEEGSLLVYRITADRFAYRVVRRLVGAMVEVGLGRIEPGLVARLLEEPRPGAAAPHTAPPSGLFLERVDYPPVRPGARGGNAARGARPR